MAKDVGREVVDRVLRRAAADELEPVRASPGRESVAPSREERRERRKAACADAPLHVPPLRTPERHNPLLRKHVQREGIDTLLVDDDKVLDLAHGVALGVELLIADETLEFDDLAHFGVGEAALGLDELLALFGRGVEEARVDLAARVRNQSGERIEEREKGGRTSSRTRARR